MTLRFGTDGVRGVAGSELTPELTVALGRAAAAVLGAGRTRPVFLIGRDTRLSGPMIQAALSAGLAAEGADVVDLGVLPTPAVAAVAAERGVMAAVVSASHNPFGDNGVKLLSAGGRKLTDDEEARIEAILHPGPAPAPDAAATPPPTGERIGRIAADPTAAAWYCEKVVSALEGRSLDGVRVVVDCANGAASVTAGAILEAAGASVVAVLNAEPDGVNINRESGSTDPAALTRAVLESGADAGLAFDGDADRVIAVDGAGGVVDGDRLLALFARDLHDRGRLAGGTLVVTVMSNLGLRRAMADAGIKVHETPVGDRNVLEALDSNGWSLGGEQSGHIIFRDVATTGDGVLSGLMLLDLVRRSGRPLAEIASEAMVRMPQVLRNVRVAGGAAAAQVAGSDAVSAAVRDVEAELGEQGRVLLRASGTEPVIRVMVEAETERAAEAAAERLAGAVESAGGG